MQKLGLKERMQETEILGAWKTLVGEFIAAHSCPIALREGILYVHVLQPALHYELDRVNKPEILRKLKQRFGAPGDSRPALSPRLATWTTSDEDLACRSNAMAASFYRRRFFLRR